MRILSFIFSIILLTISGGIWSPAGAIEAREALVLCDKNPNCTPKTNDNGSVDLTVNTSEGTKYIYCPQKGQCSCVACRKNGKKGLKADVASTLTGGLVGNQSVGTSARQTTSWNTSELQGVYDRNDIATACAKAGGKPWSNLDGYGCEKENCDGKGNSCEVKCQEATKKCQGRTPARLAGGKTLRHVLGVKASGVANPTRDPRPPRNPNPPRNPSLLTGGNILDGGSGFGTQGPTATGAPLSTGGKGSPPPGKIN